MLMSLMDKILLCKRANIEFIIDQLKNTSLLHLTSLKVLHDFSDNGDILRSLRRKWYDRSIDLLAFHTKRNMIT